MQPYQTSTEILRLLPACVPVVQVPAQIMVEVISLLLWPASSAKSLVHPVVIPPDRWRCSRLPCAPLVLEPLVLPLASATVESVASGVEVWKRVVGRAARVTWRLVWTWQVNATVPTALFFIYHYSIWCPASTCRPGLDAHGRRAPRHCRHDRQSCQLSSERLTIVSCCVSRKKRPFLPAMLATL